MRWLLETAREKERIIVEFFWSTNRATSRPRVGTMHRAARIIKASLRLGRHTSIKSMYAYIHDVEEGEGDEVEHSN